MPPKSPQSQGGDGDIDADEVVVDIDIHDPPAGQKSGQSDASLTLTWKNVSVHTIPSRKFVCCGPMEESVTLLHETSGACKAQFVAIMGPSGSGKTTFLNLLAKQLGSYSTGPETTVLLGGQKYKLSHLKDVAGFVQANDVLFPHLTVRETLEFGARLRMAANLSDEEKIERVNQIIGRLGLEKCQHTKIGDSIIRGVSGGERKRVCIALELLNRPRVLLLDTPTSGLDSATSFSVCSLLADLARSGECTVVCSLNQPQIKIFRLFDEIMLLHEGNVLFKGPPKAVLQAFAQAGFPSPPSSNPADHLLDVITPLFAEDVPHIQQNLQLLRPCLQKKMVDAERESRVDPSPNEDIKGHRRPSWPYQMWMILQRSFLGQYRDRFSIVLQIIQTVIMGVLIGTVFLDIGTDQTSISKRQSVLFFCCVNQGVFAALLAVNTYPGDRAVVLRERGAGTYKISAYFTAKTIVDCLVQGIYPALFSCIVYWLVGLQADAGKFFLFMLFMELCSLCAFSWALLTSAICVTVSKSLSVLPLVFEIWRLFGGFFLSPAELPTYFVWIDSVSYIKYTYVGISLNELEGLEYTCTSSQLRNGTCPVTSGQQTIDRLGLDFISAGGCVGVLIGLFMGLRFLAYLAIRYNKS